MTDSAASAEALLGIERDGDVSAFPDAFDVGPAAVTDAVADGPDAGELVELAAGGGDTGRDGIGIVGDVHGRIDTFGREHAGEFFGQTHALDLGEIRRVFNDAVADDAGDGDADRVDVAFADDGHDFAGEDFNELADGESAERVDLVGVLGIAHGFSCKAHILEPAGNNMFCNDNADCGSHFALRGDHAVR